LRDLGGLTFALHGRVQAHPVLQQPGHPPAHLGRVGALGQVEPQAVRAGGGRTQRGVPDPVHLADRGQDRLHVEPFLPVLDRQEIAAAQVRRDARQSGGLGGGLH
jgi:hypothetical protein